MVQEQISDLRVTSRTAEFISALNLLGQTQEQFLNAFCALYGEEQGNKLFNERLTAFDTARDGISEFLTMSIVTSLGNREMKGTV